MPWRWCLLILALFGAASAQGMHSVIMLQWGTCMGSFVGLLGSKLLEMCADSSPSSIWLPIPCASPATIDQNAKRWHCHLRCNDEHGSNLAGRAD